jgi:transposase
MDVLYKSCCGIDVHAKNLLACLIKDGKREIRTFSTMTSELLRLLDWLLANKCTHLAIESTGVYWKPVFNILEGHLEVVLVNARHIKTVPGRKTDVKDCEWIADCLRHGLLQPSFIPPRHIRDLRELTRYRFTLVKERGSLANRIQKIAESANIKLSEVVSDALGESSLAMLRALAGGETDVVKMSEFARGRLRSKIPQLRLALEGRLTEAQRWVLSELLDRYSELEAAISKAEEKIEQQIKESPDPFVGEAISYLDTIVGVGRRVAEVMVSEMGVSMEQFPSSGHISSWAGMCPGNNESAGKRRSGRTTKGSKYLRAALVQAAWAASKKKDSYLAAQFHRLARRKGKKKAAVAVGHSILVIAYHVLKRRESYKEMGGDYFDRKNVEGQKRRLIRQLEALGLRVTVEEVGEAA